MEMHTVALIDQSFLSNSRFTTCLSACSPSKANAHHIRSKSLNRLNKFNKHNNTLLIQALSDENLDTALEWLRHNSRHNDYSDVWGYCHDWDAHKIVLFQAIKTNNFRFQPVHDIEITNEQGQRNYRELRCAEDRILIRTLAQILKPIISAATPSECTHLSDRGGLKCTVKDTQQALHQQPQAFVYKSDVKGYYASIQHPILHDQLCALLPNEPILCRLLWQFMQRTVERGGNYRDIQQGIPLGASLSPLLAAIYLIPLDKAFNQNPDLFYRRYMDDWVNVCHSRRVLRQTTKKVYRIMKSLNVEIHPDKTWLGRAKNGFDFLRFRITPTSIHPSSTSVSRRDSKVARLYEQGASTKRIGQHLRRWLGWSIVTIASTVPYAHAAPGDPYAPFGSCASSVDHLGQHQFAAPITNISGSLVIAGNQVIPGQGGFRFFSTPIGSRYSFVTYSTTPPSTATTTPTSLADTAAEPVSTALPQTVYVSAGAGPLNEVCTYQYTLAGVGNALTRTNFTIYSRQAPSTPSATAVPIFTPFGLIALTSGLLWFGRRRAIKLKKTI